MRTAVTHAPVAAAAAPTPSRFRSDIEGLRGVAILLVVLYHAGVPGISGGYVGVDVFFALSGYLITGMLVREYRDSGRLDLLGFYARRARRLLPAAALVLLATILVGMLVLSPLEQRPLSYTALATAGYVSNLWFMYVATDYFASAMVENPLLHTWSLAVEEQFYLVWPALLLVPLHRGRSLGWAMAGVAVLSFGAAVWLTEVRQPWAFFGFPLRAWEFAAGGLASLLPASLLRGRPGAVRALAWGGLGALLGAAVWFTESTPFPGTAALLPVLGTLAVLTAGSSRDDGRVLRVLDAGTTQRLGAWSYSWYLWHWPALVYAKVLAPEISVVGLVLVALGSLGVAVAAHRLVENPIRFHPYLVRRPLHSLSLVVLLAGLGMTSALVWRSYAGWAGQRPGQVAFTNARSDGAPVDRDCMPTATEPGFRECSYGETGGPVVVLFGDSHAAQWYPALTRIADEHGVRVITLLRSACPVARVTVHNRILQRDYTECDEWREEALARIAELRPALVIAASLSLYVFQRGFELDDRSSVTLEEWREGVRSTLAALAGSGVPTLWLRDTPRATHSVPECLARAAMPLHRFRNVPCGPDPAVGLAGEVFAAEAAAARGFPGVHLADLTDLFCTGERCDPIKDGMVVYRDEHHLTATYAAVLAPHLWSRMARILGS